MLRKIVGNYRNKLRIRAAAAQLPDSRLKQALLNQKRSSYFWQIERRRKQLLHSTNSFTNVDYGAGPDGSCSPKMQRAGVISTVDIKTATSWSKNDRSCKLLYSIVAVIDPRRVLELGTCVGISGSYIAAALLKNNARGRLVTIEGSPGAHDIAKDTFCQLRVAHLIDAICGKFQDVLPAILKDNYFDLAFMDGHHDGDATVSYFKEIKPRMVQNSIMVFDDIEWSSSMKFAWEKIRSDAAIKCATTINGMGFLEIRD